MWRVRGDEGPWGLVAIAGLDKCLYFPVCTCERLKELTGTHVYRKFVFEWIYTYKFLLIYFPSLWKCHFCNIC